MLTLDDLEHFSDPSLTRLFSAGQRGKDPDTVARISRILACLNACRDVPNSELREGGMVRARHHLKAALRNQRRSRRPDPEALLEALELALTALGGATSAPDEPQREDRLEVEAEIQSAAGKWTYEDTLDPELMGSLARGEFEILPSSELTPLEDVAGKYGGSTRVNLDLILDTEGPSDVVRVHLVIEGGLWRWSAQEGCCMSRNGDTVVFLPPEDAVVQALLAGLAVRSGRPALAWAEAVGAAPSDED